MKIYAIADLHLCLSCPEKDMAVFGPAWENYIDRLQKHWRQTITEHDWVLLAGDITWAKHDVQADIDLKWIADLPGKKVLTKGNHDYWWPSKAKLKNLLPPGIFSAQGELVEINSSIAVVGTRLWDTPEYGFSSIIDWKPGPNGSVSSIEEDPAIFERELLRLESALKLFQKHHTTRMVMVHYPPIGLDLHPSRASELLEKYGVNMCVFGHLHSIFPQVPLFGKARGVEYIFTAADYLQFHPKLIMEVMDDLL